MDTPKCQRNILVRSPSRWIRSIAELAQTGRTSALGMQLRDAGYGYVR